MLVVMLLGSINLDGIVDSIDNVNNSILEQTSGDIARDNWWRNTYNELFVLDSGDLADISVFMSSTFPSGEIMAFYQPLEDFFTSGDPEDFIISWPNIPLNLTFFGGEVLTSGDIISSGDINFSQLARDNNTISTIKSWVNIIFGFSLLAILAIEQIQVTLCGIGFDSSGLLGFLHAEDSLLRSQALEQESLQPREYLTTHTNMASGRTTITHTTSQRIKR